MREILEGALKVCDSAEVYYREILSTTVSIERGKIQEILSNKKNEVSLRIVKDGNMGTAVATSLEDETLIERALISLKHQKSEPIEFPNEPMSDVYCDSAEVKEMTTEELVEFAMGVSNRLKETAPDVATGVYVSKEIKGVRLMNSAGFDDGYEYTNVLLGMNTYNEQGFYGAVKEYATAKLPTVRQADIDKLIFRHRLDEKPVSLGNERMPVIFTGNVMGALMLRVLGGVNGGNVVKELSPLIGKIDMPIFSDKITIRDDGGMPFGCNSFKFDDEGVRARNTTLFEKGVLRNYLLNIGQAKKLDMKPTGNAVKRTLFSKEIEDAPSVFDTNMVIEGDSVPDEEIIKSVKRGLLITGVMGAHTGNIIQGEFSLNISSGFLIENGELVGKVKGCMIAGNIYDLFKNVEAVGSEYEVMRSIFYNMGYSPMVLFSEANIVGQ